MSQNDVSNLSDTIIPRSDQLNADSLLSGALTIMVTGVSRGNAEQPVTIHYQDDNGMPYKPCKSMRKVLIFAWGDDGREWIGKSMTLFNNPEVKWGGVKVGGIRISHMSHIQSDIAISLAATKGKKETHVIKKLVAQNKQQQKPAPDQNADKKTVDQHKADLKAEAAKGMEALKAAWAKVPKPIKTAIDPNGCPDEYKTIAKKADEPPLVVEPEPEPQPEPEPVSELNPPPADDFDF